MNVEQLMSKNVKTCSAYDTLELAARIMWENDCGAVPIVDTDNRPIGMITDRDICMAGYTQGMQYWQIPVSTAASKTIFSVHPSDSLQTAEEMMRAHQVRRLVVTNDRGQLVGILSLGDLARHAGRRADDVSVDEVAQTLSAVCLRKPEAATAGVIGGP